MSREKRKIEVSDSGESSVSVDEKKIETISVEEKNARISYALDHLADMMKIYGRKRDIEEEKGKFVPPPAVHVSTEVFRVKNDKNGKEIPRIKYEFYELVRKIRNNLPVVVLLNRLKAYVDYIGEIENLGFWEEGIMATSFVAPAHERQFQDTYWWWYYRDVYTEPVTSIKKPGITKVLLTLGSFGRAELSRTYSGLNRTPTIYRGHFSFYEQNKYLRLRFNFKNSAPRYLRILVHLNANMEFGLAGAINAEMRIHLTTGIIVRIKDFEEKMRNETTFTPYDGMDDSIPKFVKSYLAKKEQNMINIPNISSEGRFWDWKRTQDYKSKLKKANSKNSDDPDLSF